MASISARGLLDRWGVLQVDPAAALAASERLQAFVAAHYPQGTPCFEWPVHAEFEGQVTAGRVDMPCVPASAYQPVGVGAVVGVGV